MTNTTTPRALPSQSMIDTFAADGRRTAELVRDLGGKAQRAHLIDMAHKRSDLQLTTSRAWAHAVLDVFGVTP